MRLNLEIPLPLSEASVRARLAVGPMAQRSEAESARLDQVMQEFESLLIEQMLKQMRKNVPDSPIFGESRSREIFNEMLDGEYAKAMEKRGGLGLARFMLEKMEKG
jgi:flagellar protein FlgJ